MPGISLDDAPPASIFRTVRLSGVAELSRKRGSDAVFKLGLGQVRLIKIARVLRLVNIDAAELQRKFECDGGACSQVLGDGIPLS